MDAIERLATVVGNPLPAPAQTASTGVQPDGIVESALARDIQHALDFSETMEVGPLAQLAEKVGQPPKQPPKQPENQPKPSQSSSSNASIKGGDPEKFKESCGGGEEGLESGGGGGGDPSDIFAQMFGGGGRGGGGSSGKKKGKPVVHNIDVTLEQIYSGHMKKLAINRTVIDPTIGVKTCDTCDGRGSVMKVMRMGNMITQSQQPCAPCNGEGHMFKTKKEKEILEVYVEKGAPDGHKVIIYNKANEQPNQEPGDVHFVVNEKPHAVFTRVSLFI